ncbi:MAG: hypothetical protein ACMXX7_01125 [Candidatus Woesearchaeota archaeon]
MKIQKILSSVQNILEKHYVKITFLIMYLLLILLVLKDFILKSKLQEWDMIGHLFSAKFTSEYLFPNITGWNPYFFLGYAQNMYYSPLLSYVTAALSKIMPLEIAFKAIISIGVLALPISLYFLAGSITKDKQKKTFTTFLLLSLFFLIFYQEIGGDFYSTFTVGLAPNFVAILLSIIYLGLILRQSQNKYLLTFLLASIVLTHIMTGIAIVIISLTLFLFEVYKKNFAQIKTYIFHYIASFLLSAFWTVPLLLNLYQSSAMTQTSSSIFITVGVLSAFLFVKSIKEKKELKAKISLATLVLVLTLTLLHFANISLHFYRYTFIITLIFSLLLFSYIKKDLILYVIITFLILTVITATYPATQYEYVEVTKDLENNVDGRVAVMPSFNDGLPPHFFTHYLASNKFEVSRGLFVESTKTSKYVFYSDGRLLNMTYPRHWGIYIRSDLLEYTNQSQKILKEQLRYLNINYVLDYGYNNLTPIQTLEYKRKTKGGFLDSELFLFEVANNSLIEILNYTPLVVKEDFFEEWFNTNSILNGVYVLEKTPRDIGTGKEEFEITYKSKNQDHIIINAESNYTVPILIKKSYHKNWKAYLENGEETKIYRASPNIMLVYAKGEIELKFEKTNTEKTAMIISLLTLLTLMVLIIWKK